MEDQMARHFFRASLACAAALTLAGCGGGGGDPTPDAQALGDTEARAYAADASVMPMSAADGIDAAADALGRALSTRPFGASAPDRQALAATEAAPLATTAEIVHECSAGGRIVWTATGASAAELDNGRFDAGEVYSVRYEDCATVGGRSLTGSSTVTVIARSTGLIELGLVMSGLAYTSPMGGFTLSGSVQRRLEWVQSDDGSQALTGRLTANSVALATTIGQRQASYTLSSLDWTVSRGLSADGSEFRRSHEGALQMAAVTPRRPDATLDIASAGSLTANDDGLTASGTLRVTNTANEWNVVYGGGSATITIDFGRDGTIDRTWTLERGDFHDDAG
jgi:hypothetical protein